MPVGLFRSEGGWVHNMKYDGSADRMYAARCIGSGLGKPGPDFFDEVQT
jgi:hypothetical protein